jgi:hypothetical protein
MRAERRMLVLFPKLTARDLCVIAVLTALCVGVSYALIGLPNVNVMDLVVFVTGFVFGAPIGVATGVLAWFVYGAINPLGFNIPIWMATMAGEAAFGVVGGVLGRMSHQDAGKPVNAFRFSCEMALWGLIVTVIYDLFTNLVYAFAFQVPVVAAIVAGWFLPPWFGILHGVSNLLLFFSAVYPLTKTIGTLRGGDKA